MNIDRAKELASENHWAGFKTDSFSNGLAILKKYGVKECELAAEHDIIFFGTYETTVKLMTEEDFLTLLSYGWGEYEEAWSYVVYFPHLAE